MKIFLEWNTLILKFRLVFVLNGSLVRNKNIKVLLLREQCCPGSTFTCAQYDDSFAHLSFNVARQMIANKIPMIQKRVTIFASGIFRF